MRKREREKERERRDREREKTQGTPKTEEMRLLYHVTSYDLLVAHANIMFCLFLFLLQLKERDRLETSVKMIAKKENQANIEVLQIRSNTQNLD